MNVVRTWLSQPSLTWIRKSNRGRNLTRVFAAERWALSSSPWSLRGAWRRCGNVEISRGAAACLGLASAALVTYASEPVAAEESSKPSVKRSSASSNSRPDPEKELLHQHRTIFLTGVIDAKQARVICAQLLFLDAMNSREPILLIINSNGGNVTDGFAIYDTMKYIDAPIHTCCMGQASSMAALLLAGGVKGRRTASPNSRIMIHSASNSVAKMQTEDVVIRAGELQQKNEMLLHVLAKDTNQDAEVLRSSFGRNFYMSAECAKEFGIIDAIAHGKRTHQRDCCADEAIGCDSNAVKERDQSQ